MNLKFVFEIAHRRMVLNMEFNYVCWTYYLSPHTLKCILFLQSFKNIIIKIAIFVDTLIYKYNRQGSFFILY